MALIPTVGRKSWSMRLLIATLYIALTIGALTMVYPFLVMLSTSIRSGVDLNDYSVVPRYLYDDATLFAKYAEIKYAANMERINGYYGTDFVKTEDIRIPQKSGLSPEQLDLVNDWNSFLNTVDPKYKTANFGPIPIVTAPTKLIDDYRRWVRQRFSGSIKSLNRAYREENTSFEQVMPPFERPTSREWQPDTSTKTQDWLIFEKTLRAEGLSAVACDPLFSAFLKQDIYNGDIAKLNAAYGTNYKSFNEIHLSTAPPTNPTQRADWEAFVRSILPFRYMNVSALAQPAYRVFLSKRYSGRIYDFNKAYGTTYVSFDQIALPHNAPAEGIALTDWKEFIGKAVPIDSVRVVNTETLFRDFVVQKYGTLDSVNTRYGLHLTSILSLSPPYYTSDWDYVLRQSSPLRRHFVTRNYAMVFNFILFHGRAVVNTIVFCLAVILTHLIVNPLCAYALSRYNLKYAYKVLLFLLATMAFPAEVAMIPNFLLLKELNLLNTYWALVLPGMASGFSIFLLKGFFDSLPKELYEAAIIDGASEPMMFWKITMPLSKPIFAVIALQSFTAAYGAFMFAFLVCQNPKMWTMMVWLYELQITAPKFITMAALTVAALPTLLIFVLCQNVIMKGI
ncbi:MAG TPA: ABC transporter permease subunit, partial [Armatimonadota bacterium]